MTKLDVLAVSGLILFLGGFILVVYQIDQINLSIPKLAKIGLALIFAGFVLIYLKQRGFKLTA